MEIQDNKINLFQYMVNTLKGCPNNDILSYNGLLFCRTDGLAASVNNP